MQHIFNCDIMFCKNEDDDYHCDVSWYESPLTVCGDGEVPSHERYCHISKSKLRSIFKNHRQFDELQEIMVSRYEHGSHRMKKVRYVYVLG